jgi:hypothetical protein
MVDNDWLTGLIVRSAMWLTGWHRLGMWKMAGIAGIVGIAGVCRRSWALLGFLRMAGDVMVSLQLQRWLAMTVSVGLKASGPAVGD